MATRKRASKTSSKASAKKTPAKKASKSARPKKASARKKADGSRASKMRKKATPRKRAARVIKRITGAAVDAVGKVLSVVETCGQCVRRILREESGREPIGPETLNELFDNCNPGVIQRLRTRFTACSSANANFNCNTTVSQVIARVCGVS